MFKRHPDPIERANDLRRRILNLEAQIEILASELRHLLMRDEAPKPDVER